MAYFTFVSHVTYIFQISDVNVEFFFKWKVDKKIIIICYI